MPDLVVGSVAAIVGILVGFWLRGAAAAKRSAELERDLGSVRNELTQAQAESAARAGFEALAGERDRSLGDLRGELQAKPSPSVC